MIVNFLKFFHLILALGILGLAITCFCMLTVVKEYNHRLFIRFNTLIISLSLLAMLTGTFLVYPKHFNFHTPWIVAAYTLLGVFIAGVGFLIWVARKRFARWIWQLVYLVLIIMLVLIVHDAVTKTTFF